jgi:hypothetical protein
MRLDEVHLQNVGTELMAEGQESFWLNRAFSAQKIPVLICDLPKARPAFGANIIALPFVAFA